MLQKRVIKIYIMGHKYFIIQQMKYFLISVFVMVFILLFLLQHPENLVQILPFRHLYQSKLVYK